MEIIKKKSKDLKPKELDSMYKIIIHNQYQTFKNFIEKETDRELWTNSLLNSDLDVILVFDKNYLIAYLEYADKLDEFILCEIQISDEYKADHITFRTLLTEFYKSIRENSIIKCHINDENKKSFNTFNSIGLKKIKKALYILSYDGLKKYVKKISKPIDIK